MRWMLAGLGLAIAAPVAAQEREYCPSRPGLGTTPCTIAPGHVSLETAIADWTRESDADARTDTVLIGDSMVRVGVTDTVEVQVGWTPYGHVRMRDKASGAVDRASRVGDVYVGAKANLSHPDGSGFSAAVQPFVTLPVGRSPVGAGDWGAGLLAPISYDVGDALNLQFTPELDAAVDEDGDGRHLAFSGTIGASLDLTEALTGTVEVQALRDDDPSGATTQRLAGVSLAWILGDALQIDTGANAALDHAAPDIEVYVGISRRF